MKHETFYATIAGVLPVLVLAYVVELRGLFREKERLESVGVSVFIFATSLIVGTCLIFGEVLALDALSNAHDSTTLRNTLAAIAGFLVLYLVATWIVRAAAGINRQHPASYLWFLVAATVYFGLVTLLVTLIVAS